MLEELIETMWHEYSPGGHRELLAGLWEQERWFDTPHQRRAAQVLCEAMRAGGAEAEIVPYAADGRTRWQDWTTHLAWECPSARLSAGRGVLADRQACPQAVVYWSGPMAPTSAGVVDGDAMETIDPRRVAGRFVLTARPPREMKQRLLGMGPAAVVSDYLGEVRGSDEHTTKWCNTWADGPDGWYFRAGDEAMPGFCLSPASGAELRRLLAADPGLQLAGRCDSRVYEGTGQCVTGLVRGADPSREVWLFGHACEQGASDNCSGVSILGESLRLLGAMIEGGLLPRPRYSIRAIATEECLGMLAFATEHKGIRRRALAGFNIDAVGDATAPDRPIGLHFGPLSSPTIGWPLAAELGRLLGRRSGGQYHVRCRREPPTADDMIADPNCGIPTLWLGIGREATGYHSSHDTPAICSDVSLRCGAIMAAAWAYVLAAMDERWLGELLAPAGRFIDEHVLPADEGDAVHLRRWAAGRIFRDAARWHLPAGACEPAAERYCPASAGPLPEPGGPGPTCRRRTWGTCTLEQLPAERTRGLGRWSQWQASGLYWTDGVRPVSDVERLVKAEIEAVPEGGVGRLMEVCEEAGLVERREE